MLIAIKHELQTLICMLETLLIYTSDRKEAVKENLFQTTDLAVTLSL